MTQCKISYTVSNSAVAVVHNGKSYTVKKGAPNYERLRKALVAHDWDTAVKNLTVAKSVAYWAKGAFELKDEVVYHNGDPLPTDLNDRILEMAASGEDPTPICKFWERLQLNPSWRSVQQLWGFLQHQGIPLTTDGHFLAYKSVRKDYKDHHTGTIINEPGVTIDVPRNKISDDPDHACHFGLHVGALEYARTFHSTDDSKLIICKVNPADVVCVPHDESQQKMRVCRYEVVGHHNGEYMPSTLIQDVNTAGDKKSTKQGRRGRKSRFDNMDASDLMKQSIDSLRQYANRNLKIVGASKIAGGKMALVGRIMDVRREYDDV